MFVAITNTPRDYAWGSTTAIAELVGQAPSGSPEAELWLGAHAGSPSRIVGAEPDAPQTLLELVQRDPSATLGERVVAEHGERLPFLLKVLAAAGPLSLQAHPSPEQARTGFEFENAAGIPLDAAHRNYKDAFHKPELIVALSESFEALCGFRAVSDVLAIVEELRRADAATSDPQPDVLDAFGNRLSGEQGVRNTVEWLLRDGRAEAERGESNGAVTRLVALVVALSASESLQSGVFAREFSTVRLLADAYPGDPGIVLSLLLNRVTLSRGEALYLPAGNIHAYLDGLGIELMAASDNVLRGGLTPKHIDVDELLQVLNFEPAVVPYMVAEKPAPGVTVYRPDVPDFVLYDVELTAEIEAASVPLTGAAIALCTAGELRLVGTHNSAVITRGESVFVSPDENQILVTGEGTLFVATVG